MDLVVAGILAVACIIGAATIDGPTSRRAVVASGARLGLDELALVAGLRDDEGQALRAEPLPVAVVQGAGPTWIADAVRDAMAREGSFAEGDSQHLIRAEVAMAPRTMAVSLRLWRQGWDVRGASPVLLRFVPWLPLVAGIVGAVIGLWRRRLSLAVFAAGLLTQFGLLLMPSPAATSYMMGSESAGAAFSGAGHSPMIWTIQRWVAGGGATLTAVLGGILATSLMLVVFDHRRSSGKDDAMALTSAGSVALAYGVGIAAWVEGAGRAGLLAAWWVPSALVGTAALLGLCIIVGSRAWLARREQASASTANPVSQPDVESGGADA